MCDKIRRNEGRRCSVLMVYYSYNFSSGSLLEVFLLFWQIEELCIISKFKISNFESLFRKRRRRSFHGFGF